MAQSIVRKQAEDEHYRFDCVNVNIGIIGVTRRVGTTTVALGLVNFIKNHGGTACYVALNLNHHLESIANAYNFIVSDFGDIKREAVKRYKESDVHLLCGASHKMHEIADFAEGLKSVKSVSPQLLTYMPNPDYAQLFSTTVTREPTIIKPVENMLDFKTNGLVFKEIVEKYIVETSKRL